MCVAVGIEYVLLWASVTCQFFNYVQNVCLLGSANISSHYIDRGLGSLITNHNYAPCFCPEDTKWLAGPCVLWSNLVLEYCKHSPGFSDGGEDCSFGARGGNGLMKKHWTKCGECKNAAKTTNRQAIKITIIVRVPNIWQHIWVAAWHERQIKAIWKLHYLRWKRLPQSALVSSSKRTKHWEFCVY